MTLERNQASNSSQSAFTPNAEAEIDLSQLFLALRRAWLPLLLLPTLLAAGTYLLAKRQPPVYQASSSVMSTMPDNSNRMLSGASVTASQLPEGAVQEVVHSASTVQRVTGIINASTLPSALKTRITKDLKAELARESYQRVRVQARLDLYQRGVYDLTATAESPQAAQVLANAATQALLTWDQERARLNVARARKNIQEQLDNVTKRLNTLPAGSVEQQSLIAARGQLVLDLSQATVFEGGATGSLTLLKEANAPSRSVSPRPTRNAVLVWLLTLLLGTGVVLLRQVLRQKVQSSADLLGLGIPVLGELPRLNRAARSSTVKQAKQGQLYEPAGFVRVNLSGLLPGEHKLIAVSSARPGEGKSSLVAAIATSFAQSGKRVLIIDVDLHRPSQHEFWPLAGQPWVALPGSTEARQTSVVQAIEEPFTASAVDAGEGVHLLPAGTVGRRAAALLSNPDFPVLLRRWAQGYDVVLLDTPPVLALADAFVVAQHTDGMLLVVESGQTTVTEIQRVMQTMQTTNTRLLGMVLNKVRRGEAGYVYSYNYASAP